MSDENQERKVFIERIGETSKFRFVDENGKPVTLTVKPGEELIVTNGKVTIVKEDQNRSIP